MMVERKQVIRPENARQYRQRSVSVLPRSDPTQGLTASNHVEAPEASAAPLQLVLSRNTYERLAAAKRAQYGLTDELRAEALAMKERQQEELRIFREFRELAEKEKRQREETLRQQQLDDLQQRMLEFQTLRAIEEEERNAEVARRREAEAQMREEAIRQRQAEQDRILAERIAEEAARIEQEQIQLREAEERERIRRERFRECAVCMEEDDMGSMVQAPCAHWYCREDLQTVSLLLSGDSGRPLHHRNRGLSREVSPSDVGAKNPKSSLLLKQGLRCLFAPDTVPRTRHSNLSYVPVYDV
ncbi:hypothetical protein Hte_005333 [Hypoxylon texense]